MSEFNLGDYVVVSTPDETEEAGKIERIEDGLIYLEGDDFGYPVSMAIHAEAAQPPAATSADGGEGADRDAMLRNDLFGSVQEVLNRHHPPVGEKFQKYRNLAEKQIQERDAHLAAARSALDAAVDAMQQGLRDHIDATWECKLYADTLNDILRITLKDITQHEMSTSIRYQIRDMFSPSVARQHQLGKDREVWEREALQAANPSADSEGGV